MLLITMEPGDRVVLGEGRDMIILEMKRKTRTGAQVGFDAPQDIKITRVPKNRTSRNAPEPETATMEADENRGNR